MKPRNNSATFAPLKNGSVLFYPSDRPSNEDIASVLATFEGELCSFVNDFSLHAATVAKEHRQKDLRQLLRYMLRPPISNDRIESQPDGDILYRLKTRFSDGTTHIQFSPEEFLERLCALIPIPYVNMVRYNGVFAPASPLRSAIVPGAATKETEEQDASSRIEWSELLRRTFQFDVLSCKCGGKLRLIALVKGRGLEIPITAKRNVPCTGPPNTDL